MEHVFLFVRYSSRNLSSPVKANLHFSQSRSGVVSLDRAEAVIEITEWVEVPVKNLTAENSTTSTPNITLEAGPENTTNTGEETVNKDSGLNGTASSTVEEPNNEGIVMEKKLKKRTFRVPLKVEFLKVALFTFLRRKVFVVTGLIGQVFCTFCEL